MEGGARAQRRVFVGPVEDLLRITVEFRPEARTIELSGELDLSGSRRLGEVLESALSSDVETVVVDLSALEFIDSAGLATLLGHARTRAAREGRLVVRRGRGQVERMIALAGADEVLALAG